MVFSHGMLCTPRQRGAYRATDRCGSSLSSPVNAVVDYCPHCLNGGSAGTVGDNLPPGGWKAYNPLDPSFSAATTRAGMCGDPKSENDHMIGGRLMPYSTVPITKTYKAGSVVEFEVEIDTNHNGFFEFFLCDLDTCTENDISPRCFQLGKCHRLTRVPNAMCENPSMDTWYDCGPIDSLYPGRWYVPCRRGQHNGVHLVGGTKGTMRYRLPAGVTCEHCVVHWYWATANSCAAPGFLNYFKINNDPFGKTCPGDGGATGGRRPGMATCDGAQVPEEFWSCADVQITVDGKPIGEVDNPPSTSPPPIGTTTTPTITTTHVEPATILSPTYASCVSGLARCDGTLPCCDQSNVCAFRKSDCKFSCVKWWDLRDDGGPRSSC